MIYPLFFSALSLSGIAEYYAIMGLMAIFSGAPYSIAIMGGVLGLSKIVVTSWLYQNWERTSLLLKSYFLSAIVILMLLTSMGIFGFLSKAHLDQGVTNSDVAAKVAIIEEKINVEKENINLARKTISQLDSQVNAALDRSTTESGANRSASIRKSQARERTKLLEDIATAQKTIAALNEEKAPIAVELRKVEAEVGPIKYIAALIYNDNPDAGTLEKAVRAMILLIVFVFDPLAVLMFVALNQTLSYNKKDSKPIEEPITAHTIDIEEEHVNIHSYATAEDEIEIFKENTNTGISLRVLST
jgi:HD-GYP domain-containing protein (c-di-GMP phosphodiesterase class II)